MPVSKKHMEYTNNYLLENYERFTVRVPKGDKDRYKALAARLGISVNQLFIQAVERYIEDNIDALGDQSAPEVSEKP